MLYDLGKDRVETTGDRYFVAPNAAVIGQVTLGKDSSVWFCSVLRGDNDTITIGDRCNIQDSSVFHVDAGAPIVLEDEVSIGHSVTIHGCYIGAGSLIGMGATILNHAIIGKFCIVGAQALVTERKEFPDRSMILGSPARRIRQVTDEEVEYMKWTAEHYVLRSQRYRKELTSR
jgi:carbonic anhydrase/acetyltransferase-like protein (isoleucine patch superfamily)